MRAVNIRREGLQTHFDVVRAARRAARRSRSTCRALHNVLNCARGDCRGERARDRGRGHPARARRLPGHRPAPAAHRRCRDGGRRASRIVDDYGHHPTEVAATLEALRQGYPGRRLVLAFQPHRYTRTRDLIDDFGKVLSPADVLLVTEVYAAGEAPIAGADGRAICRAVRSRGQRRAGVRREGRGPRRGARRT